MVGQGTSAYTVGSIIDRLLQTILTPPDAQAAQVPLTESIDATQETLKVGNFTVPEDESLFRMGSLIEGQQELMRVVEFNATTRDVVMTRGEYGTVPVAHTSPLLLTVNPVYTRASIFESVADNLITLYPKLFTTSSELLSSVTSGVFPIGDELAV